MDNTPRVIYLTNVKYMIVWILLHPGDAGRIDTMHAERRSKSSFGRQVLTSIGFLFTAPLESLGVFPLPQEMCKT